MKILNLHGFMGEADNKNYKALCGLVSPDAIRSPKLDYQNSAPREILDALSALADADDCVLVGQSLGGWYADQLSRQLHLPCILTNPCYAPHELELIAQSGIPASYTAQYREMSPQSRNPLALVLCSDADTLLPENMTSCTALAQTVQRVSGSHSTIIGLQAHLAEMLARIAGGAALPQEDRMPE